MYIKMQRVRIAKNSWREKDVLYKTHVTTVIKTEGLGKDRQIDQWIGTWAETHLPKVWLPDAQEVAGRAAGRVGGGISDLNVKGE